jgi:hypothetical protein
LGGLERARADVDAGRLWKARDRLQGSLEADPANQDVLALLGEVCFQMRDLPAAGVYWSLTERDLPPDVEAALNARFGSAQQVLRAMPARPPIERYPERVQDRLRALIAAAGEEGYRWEPKIRKLEGRGERGKLWEASVTVALLFFTLGIWVMGWIFLFTRVL